MKGKDLIVLYKRIRYMIGKEPVRPMIRYVKKEFKNDIIGLEIGTDEGMNAYSMLRTIPKHQKTLFSRPIHFLYRW